MLRAIYRALLIGRTRSAAEQVARNMTEQQLQDIGHNRLSLVAASVESITKELNSEELIRNNRAIRYPEKHGLWVIYRYSNFRRAV